VTFSPGLHPDRDERLKFGRASGGAVNYYQIPGVSAGTVVNTKNYAQNTDYYVPFILTTPIVFDQVAMEVTVSPGGSNQARMGIYVADFSMQPLGAPIIDSGNIDVSTTGVKTFTPTTPVLLGRGRYLTVLNQNGAGNMTLTVIGSTAPAVVLNTMGASGLINRMSVARTYAAFPTPGTAWTAVSNLGTVGFQHPIVFRVTA
jgi:hypothetical protein